jgi:tetratricopeptide (TPR) repeat protein
MVQALLRTNRGELAGARESLDRALGLLAPLGDRIANQQLAWIEGMIEEKSGRLSAAREKYASALEDARRLGARAEVALMLFRLAHLALAEGATDEARTRLREALDADVESLHAEAGPEIQELRRALGL